MQIDFDKDALEVKEITGQFGDEFLSNYDNSEGWLKTAWADTSGGDNSIAGAYSTLFTIKFKIKAGVVSGDKLLSVVQQDNLQYFTLTDAATVEIDKTLIQGKVTVLQIPYTVSFNSNGGSSVGCQTVSSGGTATQPSDPIRTGYSFAGWYVDDALNNAFSFTTAITADTTLYAKWTANPSYV